MAPATLTLPRRELKHTLAYYLGWAVLFALLTLSWEGADMRPFELIRDSANMAIFLGGFFPPNFAEWRMYANEMLITVEVAVWGSFLAVVCSIPLGILCAENMVPWWICQPVRRLMDACRAINDMVFAMLFVVAVGLGPFAGVLALWINTMGTLAKLFSEAVEAVDPRPVEGVRATGANWVHEVVFGVIPQVLPLWSSYSLYRFEANVRAATVLGIVGAGGIGQSLWENIRGFNYGDTAAILIIIIVSVSAIDFVSQQLRKRFI